MALEQFKNTVLFSVTIKRWGNRAQVKSADALRDYLEQLNAEDGTEKTAPAAVEGADAKAGKATKKRVTATKTLIKSDALDRLNTFLTEAKQKCLGFSMPSFVRSGMFVVSRAMIEQVEEILQSAVNKMENDLLPDFISDYPARMEDSRDLPVKKGGLGPLFDSKDYPEVTNMAERFALKWNWLALTVPEGLPPELRQAETDKLQRQFSDAATEIRNALRVMFAELVEHAVERLKVAPGEKPKTFRDSLTGNINQFFETFEAKNIMDDKALAEVVAKAREVLTGVNPDTLRADMDVRTTTAARLEEIKAALDPMVEEAKSRAFDFSED